MKNRARSFQDANFTINAAGKIHDTEGMTTLQIFPLYQISWEVEHIDANLIACGVAPLPRGIAACLLREQEGWRYEIEVAGRERVPSETSFDSASEAAIGLGIWLNRRKLIAPKPLPR